MSVSVSKDLTQECLVRVGLRWSRIDTSDDPGAYARTTLVRPWLRGALTGKQLFGTDVLGYGQLVPLSLALADGCALSHRGGPAGRALTVRGGPPAELDARPPARTSVTSPPTFPKRRSDHQVNSG